MRPAGILFVRRAVSDVTIDNNQGGPILAVLKGSERTAEHFEVIRIADTRHIPAVRDKPRSHVLGEGQRSVAFDRDVVVVVNPAKIREPKVSRKRSSLAGYSFHHAAIAA